MKRAAVGILLASLFTATAAMAGQGVTAQRADARNDHSDRRDDHDNGRGNDRGKDYGRDERRHDDRDYRGHDRVVVRHAPPPARYVRPAPVRYMVYHAPRGYYDHSWRRGERLPVAYYQRPYIISDYNAYRLYSPPRGYHWVRVNHDAVLAGITTGVVFGIVNNLFH